MNEINILPADVVRRIITNLASRYRSKRKPKDQFWAVISDITGYGSTYSAHLAKSYGFNAEDGYPL